jgi:Na+-transporting methylmalonyl-CoA/oxaloacetate decarboxylase gamma subunit
MDNLTWGLQMTVLGMGLVFGLLALLWGLLTLAQRFETEPAVAAAPDVVEALPLQGAVPEVPAAASRQGTIIQGMDAELVAAIMVATLAHRALRRREAAPVMRSYLPGSQVHASRWVGAGRARQNQSWQRRGNP